MFLLLTSGISANCSACPGPNGGALFVLPMPVTNLPIPDLIALHCDLPFAVDPAPQAELEHGMTAAH